MRRIYESEALRRDDDPFSPTEADEGRSTSFLAGDGKAIDWDSFSHAFLPVTLRNVAVTVDVSTRKRAYDPDEPIPIDVMMHNRFPFPVALRTESPVLWTWAVDELTEASRIEDSPPEEKSIIRFDRGERKRFHRRWEQRIRVSKREWVEVEPGECTISAGLNVPDAESRGLVDETTVRIDE